MTLRTLAVHADSTPACANRLVVARHLAQQHDAQLTALYATAAPLADMPYAYVAGAFSPEALNRMRQERRDHAAALVKQSLGDLASRTRWFEIDREPVLDGMVEQSFYADLLILGQRPEEPVQAGQLPPDFLESLLIGSGKPAIVVPRTADVSTVAECALVAWKPSREAARALTASLPLLQRAREVHITAWSESASRDGAGTRDLERYLRSHGVNPTMHHHREAPAELGELLLSRTADLGADLLVMGVYGHSRMREWVLGGVSRTILRSMTVPVLMSH